MSTSCPNCKTPCVGCAGAKLVLASDGVQVCTKCRSSYEMSKGRNPNAVVQLKPEQISEKTTPIINSITFNNLNN